jgi:hypothetical protein
MMKGYEGVIAKGFGVSSRYQKYAKIDCADRCTDL